MANSVEYYLIDGLSFKLSPGASYVTNRKSATWWTSGAQSYISGQGARVIRLQINGDGWLDPSTVRIIYSLRNNATNPNQLLRTISGPWSFFRRVRCMYQGAIVDGIDNYNRTHEMMSILTSQSNRDNDTVEGFGWAWDSDIYYPADTGFRGGRATSTTILDGKLNQTLEYGGVAAGGSNTVSFKPLLGLFGQSKYIPLMWGGLILEFEIVGNAEDAIISTATSHEFLSADTYVSWQIEDVRCVGDVVTLDSALQNSYAEHVLSGKSLPINCNTYITMQQTVSGENISVNVSRAVSRLKTFFMSFDSRALLTENQSQYMKNGIIFPSNGWVAL